MIDQELLIAAVREQRSLWDKRNKSYRNRLITKKAWKNVAENLGCTSDEAQGKWKNLRDSYSRELKKLSRRRSGDVEHYTGDWQYFNAMHFLRGSIRHRKPIRSTLLEDTDFIDDESFLSVLSDSTGISSNTDQSLVHGEPESFQAQLTAEIPCGSNQGTSEVVDGLLTSDALQKYYTTSVISRPIGNECTKQGDYAELFAELERQKISLMKKELDFHEDEDMNWFKSILPHLKKLPSLNKFLFRTKVQEMLLSELTSLNSSETGPSSSRAPSSSATSDTLQ